MSGDAVEMLGPLEAGEAAPGGEGLAGGLHRRVHVLGGPLRGGREHGAGGGAAGLVRLPAVRVLPRVVDEEAELAVVILQPAGRGQLSQRGREKNKSQTWFIAFSSESLYTLKTIFARDCDCSWRRSCLTPGRGRTPCCRRSPSPPGLSPSSRSPLHRLARGRGLQSTAAAGGTVTLSR